MIQRKQTLFLLQSIFLSVALLFVPSGYFELAGLELSLALVPLEHASVQSSTGHFAAIYLNFFNLVLASLIIFLYKQRSLQIKLSYVLMVCWLILGATVKFCPLVASELLPALQISWLAPIASIVACMAIYLAIRGIQKDIDLLKSADRIR